MRYGLLIILLPVFCISCKKKNNIPSGILPQKKMQAVMWDMMRADQFLSNYVLNKDSSLNKTAESISYYQQIFAIHHINENDFRKSFSYYKSHPVLFKAIMDSLSQPPGEAPTQIAIPAEIKDSIQPTPLKPAPADTSFRLKKRKIIN